MVPITQLLHRHQAAWCSSGADTFNARFLSPPSGGTGNWTLFLQQPTQFFAIYYPVLTPACWVRSAAEHPNEALVSVPIFNDCPAPWTKGVWFLVTHILNLTFVLSKGKSWFYFGEGAWCFIAANDLEKKWHAFMGFDFMKFCFHISCYLFLNSISH